jgi:hypothetical protein
MTADIRAQEMQVLQNVRKNVCEKFGKINCQLYSVHTIGQHFSCQVYLQQLFIH